MRANLDTQAIGHVVAGCGLLGIIDVLFAGWNSDRHGDRFRDAFVFTLICMSGLLAFPGSGGTITSSPRHDLPNGRGIN